MTETGNIWHGVNPTPTADSGTYEIGDVVQALRPVTLTHVRIFGHPGAADRPGRRARLWTPLNRAQVASVALPSTLPSGWLSVPLAAPLPLSAGDTLVVTYDTQGGYGFVGNALAADYVSTDGAMRFPKGPGNGRFGTVVDAYPADWALGSAPFYGVDVAYEFDPDAEEPLPPAGDKPPNSVLVATAWLREVVPYVGVGSARPTDTSSWASTGFLVVSVVGSAGTRDLSEERKPILSVDSWGVSPNSSKAPKAMTAGNLEYVRRAVEQFSPRVVAVGGQYAHALVQDAWVEAQEPREVPDPASNYAHYVQEIGISWVPLG